MVPIVSLLHCVTYFYFSFVFGSNVCFTYLLGLKYVDNKCCFTKTLLCNQDYDILNFISFRENSRFAFIAELSSRIFLKC